MEAKKVDYRFKILYAVGAIMVVSGHVQGGTISFFSDWFPYTGLHLAMFVFASGYFYKDTVEKNVVRYILKKIGQLIVPMYIYNFIYGVVVALSTNIGFSIGAELNWENLLLLPIRHGHQFIYNMGGWFVVPLFMIEVSNVLFRKMLNVFRIRVPEIVNLLIGICIGGGGNTLACMGYNTGWWVVLVRFCYFIPFYCMGIYYKKDFEKIDKKIPSIVVFSVLFAIKIILACIYGKMPVYTPSWCRDFTEGPIIPIIVGAVGIAFWLRIATIFEPAIGRSKYVNLIANNTYSIMMNQFLGFMMLKTMYGVISKISPFFGDFDWSSYKSNIWWYYIPGGNQYTRILYLVAGIIVPIVIQQLINLVKENGLVWVKQR